MDKFSHGEGDGRPSSDEAFWRELQANFETALDLLREIAEAHGIDPTAAAPASVADREQRLDDAASTHPLSVAASDYAQQVNHWFRRAQSRIQAWGEEATRAAELDAVSLQLQEDVSAVQEAVEELASQRHRIHVKLLRALRDRLRTDMHPGASIDDPAPAARDAYAGVTQSMEMWLRLRDVFPQEEDAILGLLLQLENLRKEIAETFPETTD